MGEVLQMAREAGFDIERFYDFGAEEFVSNFEGDDISKHITNLIIIAMAKGATVEREACSQEATNVLTDLLPAIKNLNESYVRGFESGGNAVLNAINSRSNSDQADVAKTDSAGQLQELNEVRESAPPGLQASLILTLPTRIN